MEPLDDGEQEFLRALRRIAVTVPRVLEADLVREQGLPLGEYFALMHLSESPSRRLRMSDLATVSGVTLSGTSRLVARLEEQGCVRRERCTTDGRGYEAVLTDAGLRRLQEAWPSHLRSVRRHVFDHLAGVDVGAVARALNELAGPTSPERPD